VKPAFVPGWDIFLQEPLPSSTCARSLACLFRVAVVCRVVPLVTATPRRGRVRARARDRAGLTPLRPGAPQHARTPIWGQGRAFNPVRLRLPSPPPSRVPASPRPCRGRASLARGRQGEGPRFLGRHGRPLPGRTPTRTHGRTHARKPAAGAVLAAAHGAETGSAMHHRDASSRSQPCAPAGVAGRACTPPRTPSPCTAAPCVSRDSSAVTAPPPRPRRRRSRATPLGRSSALRAQQPEEAP
jgi:hypothetical protein